MPARIPGGERPHVPGSRLPLALAATLLLVPVAAFATELDLSGVWQINMVCGYGYSARSTIVLVEDSTTGVFTASGGFDCGSSDFEGAVHYIATCSTMPSPQTGRVVGTRLEMPQSPGADMTDFTFEEPFPSPTSGCISPPLARIRTTSRSDGIITAPGGRAVRVEGTVSFRRIELFNDDGALCLDVPIAFFPSCAITWLRAGLEVGMNRTVEPFPGVVLAFESVTAPGLVTVTQESTLAAPLPPGVTLLRNSVFEIATTATVSGSIDVCFTYPDVNGDGVVDGTNVPVSALRVFHEEAGVFVDRTEQLSVVSRQVCARVTSLLQFCIGATPCGNGARDSGEECDDGNVLDGDCCSATCTFEPAGTACTEDGNPCTANVCDGTGSCHRPLDGSCDDGDACTIDDRCSNGRCVGGGTIDCDDGNPCTAGTCDPLDGCTQRPSANGTRCKTAIGCVRGTCAAGTCERSPECACTADANCVNDGDVCNGVETCAAGECVLGAPLECPADDNPCTQAACDPVTGCGQAPVPDGTRCETPGGCTAGTCAGGTCTLGASCPCTLDAECADGNVCNGAETCNVGTGTCEAGPPVPCVPDANTCTLEVCDPTAGGCVSQATRDGAACDVEKATGCVTGSCAAGACVEDPDCNVVFTVAQDVVEIAPNAKSATIKTTCAGEKGDTCTAQGFFESPPAAGAQRDASVAVTAAAVTCDNVTTNTAITKSAKRKIKKSGQAKLKLKLNPIGKCLLRQAGSDGLRVRVSGSVTPKAGGETKLLDILVRVVRR